MNQSSGSPSILRMGAPLVVSFWMRAAFSLVDTAYAATIGDSAVAGIGLTVPFELLMIALWVGLSSGLTARLSRTMGAKEGEKLDQYVRVSWRMVGVIIPLFAFVGVGIWFFAPRLALPADVVRDFRIYGTVIVVGSAFTSFWSIIPDSLVKAHQDTRTTMWAGIWSNLINVTLNTIFVFVFHWGVFGIAFSTVLGRFGGLAYAVVRVRKHEARRRALWTEPRPGLDPAPYWSILALAFPSALTFVLMSFEVAIVNRLLAFGAQATEAIAAFSIYHRVALFANQPMIAIAVAMLPFAGKLIGERDAAGVRRGLSQAMVACSLYSVLIVWPVTWWSAPAIARALAESEQTQVFAAFALRVVPLACLAAVPFMLARPIFEALGRGRPGLVLAALRYLALSIPLAWLGMRGFEAMGWQGFAGLLYGTIVAAAIASLVMWIWARASLRAEVQSAG